MSVQNKASLLAGRRNSPALLERAGCGRRLSLTLLASGGALSAGLLGCGDEGTSLRDDRGGPAGRNGGAQTTTTVGWAPPEQLEPESPVARFGQLRVEGSHLLDQAGDPVQL